MFQNVFFKEIARFMLLEAGLLTQVKWISESHLEKYENDTDISNLIHIINYK